ncbi:caspase-3-like [Haliotis cracherodii]|uniref:caspase-3-like n=1 Tax=Haliotis cracherodii TaxID=6455 RepID=UPI0039EAEB67
MTIQRKWRDVDEVDCPPLTPEQLRLLEADNEYNFFHTRRGRAIIINNINYMTETGNKPRSGAEHDTSRLLKIFANLLEFDVQIWKDLTAGDMVTKIEEAASNRYYDHTNADCFACIILSHGGEEDDRHGIPHDILHGVDGSIVYTRDLVNLLREKKCPQLKDKPKIFIIQACRGDDLDQGQVVTVQTPVNPGKHVYRRVTVRGEDDASQPYESRMRSFSDQSEDIVVSPTPLYKDFLVVYATPPGYSAWRGKYGSYFIQYLKEVFESMHQEHVPLVRTLTRTSHKMAVHFKSRTTDSTGGMKQMPCIMSMLTKDVCFRQKPVRV